MIIMDGEGTGKSKKVGLHFHPGYSGRDYKIISFGPDFGILIKGKLNDRQYGPFKLTLRSINFYTFINDGKEHTVEFFM